MTDQAIAGVLSRARLNASTETVLQQRIGEALDAAGIVYEREARLAPGERIDFLCGTVGIEAKLKCTRRKIWRQLERYAENPLITSLILVTGTAMGLPPAIGDLQGARVPLFYISIGRSAL